MHSFASCYRYCELWLLLLKNYILRLVIDIGQRGATRKVDIIIVMMYLNLLHCHGSLGSNCHYYS